MLLRIFLAFSVLQVAASSALRGDAAEVEKEEHSLSWTADPAEATDKGRDLDRFTEQSPREFDDEEADLLAWWDDYAEGEELEFLRTGERDLLQDVPCNGGGPIAYFDLKIDFVTQKGTNADKCNSSRKNNLGNAINALLVEYGIGNKGKGDNAAYLSKVCKKPKVSSKRRQRALRETGYLFSGGGSCRFCYGDDTDRRWLSNTDPNWFKSVYAPSLKNILRNAIVSEVVSKHKLCLGTNPIVQVNVVPVTRRPNTNCS